MLIPSSVSFSGCQSELALMTRWPNYVTVVSLSLRTRVRSKTPSYLSESSRFLHSLLSSSPSSMHVFVLLSFICCYLIFSLCVPAGSFVVFHERWPPPVKLYNFNSLLILLLLFFLHVSLSVPSILSTLNYSYFWFWIFFLNIFSSLWCNIYFEIEINRKK